MRAAPQPEAELGSSEPEAILSVEGLVVHFPIRGGLLRRRIGEVHAVDGVDLELRPGETTALVGESGSGKTTLARAIVRLAEPTGGRIVFRGRDITRAHGRDLAGIRRELQIVFQDPYASLNPRMTVAEIVGEPLRVHRLLPRPQRRARVLELLDTVGLAAEHADRYPHEFSGGQRQRVGIARALALEPLLLILDEPVSALDVSIQAQVVNLLTTLQKNLQLTYLVIAHDLAVVRHVSDRVAVMYLGKVVELGTRDDVYRRPAHPYTQALLSSVPLETPQERGRRERIVLQGDIPSPVNPPSGCRFRTRCWKAQQVCADIEPPLADTGIGHRVACHFADVVVRR